MSYDLHIILPQEQSDGSNVGISEAQWIALVDADIELELDMDTTLSASNLQTSEMIQMHNPLMASWIDPDSGVKHYFHYSRGIITVKNPPDVVIEKMKAVACRLGAEVQGDEGELY